MRANEDVPQGANMRFHRPRLSWHICILYKKSIPAIYLSNSTLVLLVAAGSQPLSLLCLPGAVLCDGEDVREGAAD